MTDQQTANELRQDADVADAEPRAFWWQTGVIYQVYPRSFQDSNGDGLGDLEGVTSRLDYLSDVLGIDAIWLSPFFPSPMADFGYDISNYVDVDPRFGALADFDRLVAEAHRRNIRIIVDYVPNHTSDQHPWFQESRKSRDNPKRDWYIWADAKPDGSAPNNWLSVFGGSAWEWDEATQQYFMHAFLKEQPDLNWRNPEVKQAMFDVVRFWLDRGVDGIRVDVAHGIMKDPELRDNPPNLLLEKVADNPYKNLGAYDSQLHVYDRGHPDLHAIYRDMRRLLNSYGLERPRVSIGEIHIFDYQEWATYFGAELDELHLPFNFGLLGVKWNATAVRTVVDVVESVMRPGAWPTYVVGNHDEHRIATRVGPDEARVAQMLLLTLRGTPTIYQGDEIGMTDVPIPPEAVQDPWERYTPGLGLGRDAERTPMQWEPASNAAFCPENAKPWLPVANNAKKVNVASELEDPKSMLSLSRALLRLRRETRALQIGSYRPVAEVPKETFVYLRELGEQRLLIALNFATAASKVAIPELENADILLSTHMDRQGAVEAGELTLRPNEGVIVAWH
jgi:alpha-glucosidase